MKDLFGGNAGEKRGRRASHQTETRRGGGPKNFPIPKRGSEKLKKKKKKQRFYPRLIPYGDVGSKSDA